MGQAPRRRHEARSRGRAHWIVGAVSGLGCPPVALGILALTAGDRASCPVGWASLTALRHETHVHTDALAPVRRGARASQQRSVPSRIPLWRRYRVAALRLDAAERSALASAVLACLKDALPGSVVSLQGSLAAGDADRWSDIDVEWEVPAGALLSAAARLSSALERVRPVESVRLDPDFMHSAVLRVAFVRFADTPLFWRVDVTIRQQGSGAATGGGSPDPGFEPPPRWTMVESALATVVAAAKAHLRGRVEYALALSARAASRVGVPEENGQMPLAARLKRVVNAAPIRDPSAGPLAERVNQLLTDVFG